MRVPLTIRKLPDYLLVTGNGLHSLGEAQQHFRDLSSRLVAERTSGDRQVRLMIDLREATPHPPEVEAHIGTVLPILYKEGDRVAVVVPSSAAKAQTKDTHDPVFSDVFLTREAAEHYLSRSKPQAVVPAPRSVVRPRAPAC